MNAARRAAFMLGLTARRDARAIDAPVYNPTVDTNGFGSTFDWSAMAHRRAAHGVHASAFLAVQPTLDLLHVKSVTVSCYDLPTVSIDNLRFGSD